MVPLLQQYSVESVSVESLVLLEAQKCHSYHHNLSPNFPVLGNASFISGNVELQYLPIKIGKNIANFFNYKFIMPENDECRPPTKRSFSEKNDCLNVDVNVEKNQDRTGITKQFLNKRNRN